MFLRSFLTGTTFFLAMASQVVATPPQTVSVNDALLGANDTHVFLLRSTSDNMGSYFREQTDILLIARNRATNADDEVWPVARSIDHGVEFAENGLPARVEALPLDGAVNPFDILISKNARLISGRADRPADDLHPTFLQNNNGVGLAADDTDESHSLAYAEIGTALTESLNKSREAVPPYFVEGPEPLYDIRFDPAADCDFGGFATTVEVRNGAVELEWLIKVACENDEIMAPVITYLVMSPDP